MDGRREGRRGERDGRNWCSGAMVNWLEDGRRKGWIVNGWMKWWKDGWKDELMDGWMNRRREGGIVW